ncbi:MULTISPECIES: helix-turn-helix domain-containing protein [unclassified Mucilaginibacter]|uniref:GlxA family transcriptional regulator n=1 Tax=unclassified Mucilaginibacter TaxID=2617802 RepID=UPI002AC94ED4|nr:MULTISPECIES: helix-turn-helix domain-containing protein [unclassified Mucilaginibacter]MEB0264064.1 helix-turn-helix domain-containing protein [Mucilaginibacter sp. 10I4]MEB0280883.1 helix-turn-helix domain-containing protein [Mucilaginibacter sp. 10B2]MEB0303163.1 helix-turn-helix domain-containing protein [Mucilaginibacter sp. 5C4]WPX23571.1 helix-turn-helix domain-containing protein [Mucilaginibacter sp. 5C4]
MKHISILVPYESVPSSVVDPRYMFTAVNQFLINSGKHPLFNVQLVGLTEHVPLNSGSFSVKTDVLIKDLKKTDLVVIPALAGDMKTMLRLNEELLPWIVTQHKNGAEVASLCLGAFLLASTGLLDGKSCSTHWLSANDFREMFPKVTMTEGSIITEADGLYSSGGASSYWNLLLHIVEKYAGREMSIMAAKFFAIEIDRKSQSPFVMFNGQKKHEDESVKLAQEYIEENYTLKFSVDELADKFAIGKRHFERRFKKATNNTPAEYIQRVKVEAAKKELENSAKNISEVMYDVGYTDVKAFRTVFKKLTGLSPIDYKNKYNRQAAA